MDPGGLVVIANDVTSEAQHAAEAAAVAAFGRKKVRSEGTTLPSPFLLASSSTPSIADAAAAAAASTSAAASFPLAVPSHSHLPPASGLPLVTSKSQRAAKAVVSYGVFFKSKKVSFVFEISKEVSFLFSLSLSRSDSIQSLFSLSPRSREQSKRNTIERARKKEWERGRARCADKGVGAFFPSRRRPGGRRRDAFFSFQEKKRDGRKDDEDSKVAIARRAFPASCSPVIAFSLLTGAASRREEAIYGKYKKSKLTACVAATRPPMLLFARSADAPASSPSWACCPLLMRACLGCGQFEES